MKLTYRKLAISLVSLFLFSCSNDSSTPKDESIKDDFSYLSVNSSGKIEKIGNNSGKISAYSQFDGLNSWSIINLSTIAFNSEKIFLINYIPPKNILYIFDRKTKTTTSKELVFPKEITGVEPTLSSLIWNESKNTLYGIIIDNPYNFTSENLCYFIKINPINSEINYEGLNFKQLVSTNTLLNNGKLYSSSRYDNTIEIDLESNNAKTILFNNSKMSFSNASIYDTNTAYCLRIEKGKPNSILTKLNLKDNSSEDLLTNETFGTYLINGNGFIDKTNNQYVTYTQINNSQFVSGAPVESAYRLLKYNILDKTYTALKLTSDSTIDDNILIIDKVDNN